jgi:glycosyltransferase involved in cell wall biosynthesis
MQYVPPMTTPTITIDVSPAVHKRAGLGRYAEELVHALAPKMESAGFGLRLFYTEAQNAHPTGMLAQLPASTTNLGYKPWRLSALASQYLRIARDGVYGNPTLVHATDNLLPYVRAASVFTLHDLIFEIFPEHHKLYNHLFLKLMMRRFLRAADHIICVSEHTKRDAERLYGIDPAKMTVIYEGADPKYRPATPADVARHATVRERYKLPEQFILHVSTIEPRKNLGRLLEAFEGLKREFPALKLVLVGKKGWLYEPFFEQLEASGLKNEVIFPGYVAEEDLPAFYQMATLFCFPSVYEGFGLPPLEALASGCAVVCSNASSLPEVVGDAGLLVTPTDTTAITEALRRVLGDDSLRRDLQHRGPIQAQKFSWEQAAEQTLALYKQVMAI